MRITIWSLMAGTALLLAGCASDRDELLRSTNQSVRNLERNMGTTVDQLSKTTADLTTQVDSNQQETRRLQGMIQELQAKMTGLDGKVDSLSKSFYKANNMTGAPSEVEVGAIAAPGTTPGPAPAPSESSAPMQPEPVKTADASGDYPPLAKTEKPVPQSGEATPPMAGGGATADFDAANKTFEAKNYQQASEQFAQVLSKYPKSDVAPRAQLRKGQSLMELGKYDAAATEFAKVRTAYPDSQDVPNALYNEARAYLRLGQQDKAVKLLKELIDNYPMTSLATRAKAWLQTQQGQ